MKKPKSYIHVFITKNFKFRAVIQETKGTMPYEVTIGGEEWQKGKGRDYEQIIRTKITRILQGLTLKYATLFDQPYVNELEVLKKTVEELKNPKGVVVKVQSIPDDTKVNFNLMGMGDNWESDDRLILQEIYKGMKGNEDVECKILCLATFAELGDKDHEYYDIQFDEGYILNAVSGYHLEPIKQTFQGTGGFDETLKDY